MRWGHILLLGDSSPNAMPLLLDVIFFMGFIILGWVEHILIFGE